MHVTKLETIRIAEFPQSIWVHIHTDEGLIGLGETFLNVSAVEPYLHDAITPKILGQKALANNSIARDLADYLGFRSSGVEVRGASAVDCSPLAISRIGEPHCMSGTAACRPIVTHIGP
jgi:galactonate dehydratase